MQVGTIVEWGVDVPIFGTGLTINSLNELQWHLLAIVTMLALPYALVENRHVRVDMIYGGLGPRRRVLVDLAGDLLFLLPFCVVIGYLSLRFVTFAFTTGEQSTYGGLVDRWIVKAFLPLGAAWPAVPDRHRADPDPCRHAAVPRTGAAPWVSSCCHLR
jgi:TRAP-type mannitol/chloroaromatic compound transport system permease small subunit